MTNKHEKQEQQKKRTSTMAGPPISTNFSRLQKDNKPRREEEEQHQHSNTPFNLKREVKRTNSTNF